MPRFLRSYSYNGAAYFRGAPLKFNNGWLVVGGMVDNGIIAYIGFDGTAIWQKKYSITGKKLYFNNIVKVGAEIFVSGVIPVDSTHSVHVLLQINSGGDLVNWIDLPSSEKPVLAFNTAKSRLGIKMVDLKNGNFAVAGWQNVSGSLDRAEVFVIDQKSGIIGASVNFAMDQDTQIYDGCISSDPNRKFLYLTGTDKFGGSYKGLFAVLGYQTKLGQINTAHLLNIAGSVLTEVFATYSLPNKAHLIAGTYRGNNQTNGNTVFIATVTTDDENPSPTMVIGKKLALRFGQEDKRISRIIHLGNRWLITGYYTNTIRTFVISLDLNLNVEWIKVIQTETKSLLSEAELFDGNNLVFSGYLTVENNITNPSLLYTNGQLNSCKTQAVAYEAVPDFTFTVETKNPINSFTSFPNDSPEIIRSIPEVAVESINAVFTAQCPEKEFVFSSGEKLGQSPFLHLQAVGSLGVESTAGIHLRWSLLRALGNKHLPKGNYPVAAVNFNKPDDFVQLYRLAYAPAPTPFLFLATVIPTYKDHANARWRYNHPHLGKIDIGFTDKAKYATIFSTLGNTGSIVQYLDAYKGSIVEIELKEKLAFSVEIGLTVNGNYSLDVETISTEGDFPQATTFVTARQTYSQSTIGPKRILAENLRKVRLRYNTGTLSSLSFETYEGLLAVGVETGGLEHLGSFALTKENQVAFDRLEYNPRFTVQGKWKKYNENAFVNVANYQMRWTKAGGLKQGVEKYMTLSNVANNPTAIEKADYPDIVQGGKDVLVSYLDMLQIAATDYHAARMMGLGHIDTPSSGNDIAYVYLAEYNTLGDLEDGKGARPVQHLYLSLPTAPKDQRFPEEVEIPSISYGLADQGDVILTDAGGYTPDGMARYINIFTRLKSNPVTGNTFFVPNIPFVSSNYTNAIFAGLEYRKMGEATWRKPEIAHYTELIDPNDPISPFLYRDTSGKAETSVLLFHDDGSKPSLIHKEMEAGIHEYAAYSINIFSRSGEPTLTPVATNTTTFVKRNTLLPPSDVQVQLIQRENPLLLTSFDEQKMLSAMSGDKTLVRLTFNYTHIQDGNYDFGDKFEVFFRQEMPDQVTGAITAISAFPIDKQSKVNIEDYKFLSNNETVKPLIPAAKRGKYLGGSFIHDGKRFEIKGCDANTDVNKADYPIFTVQHLEERTVITNGSQQTISVGWIGPKGPGVENKPFVAIENMSNAANWGAKNPLNFVMNIDNSQWTTKVVNTPGAYIIYRGIWNLAKIQIMSASTSWEDENNVIHTETKQNAYYQITFEAFKLKKHIQSNNVNWYKGVVRIPLANGSGWKELKVINIEQSYDANNTPTSDLVLNVGDDNLKPNEFQLNKLIEVNYYPGYRVYLKADNLKDFNQSTIMPATGIDYKNTLIGMRTIDSINNYASPIGVPAVLMAQAETPPAEAESPTGPDYATPPDIYNKSTYTFSVKFKAEPFMVALYRADINALLNALYYNGPLSDGTPKPKTVNAIKENLAKLQPDQFWFKLWKDFVTPGAAGFNQNSTWLYNFPAPEKLFFNPTGTPAQAETARKNIIAALTNAFVPLTQQPILVKKANSQLKEINQNTPAAWDNATKTLTFTDFTLDGGTNTSYFYFARDISNRMEMGPHSPIMGPIELVNTRPPAPVIIKKVLAKLPDAVNGGGASVQFDLLEPAISDKVSKIQIFRTNSDTNALYLRSMDKLPEIDISTLNPTNGVLTIFDDFQGKEIPYGDPLYYRIVGLRKVEYKDHNLGQVVIYIPSLPSKLCLTNVVDTVNPEPPILTTTNAGFLTTANGKKIQNVALAWNKTTYKGRYFLYKMTNAGQWNKILEVPNPNNQPNFSIPLSATSVGTDKLIVIDEDGEKIYHHFKVGVESTSGLLNSYDNIFTIGDI